MDGRYETIFVESMIITGEDIRQEAERREKTCPKGMKDSFYYGFREGAKWAFKVAEQNEDKYL